MDIDDLCEVFQTVGLNITPYIKYSDYERTLNAFDYKTYKSIYNEKVTLKKLIGWKK